MIRLLLLLLLLATPAYGEDKLPLPSLFDSLDRGGAKPTEPAPVAEIKQSDSPDTEKAKKLEEHFKKLDKITAAAGSPFKDSPISFGDPTNAELAAEIAELREAVVYLDLTCLTEAEVREVVKDELAKINITYQTPKGDTRSKSITVGVNGQGNFVLNAGERLVSYQDPMTGQTIMVNQMASSTISLPSQSRPVTKYSSSSAEFYFTAPSMSQTIRGAVRIPAGPARNRLIARRVAASPLYSKVAAARYCTDLNGDGKCD